MACGYGACYGCAVEIDGRLQRLCVEGPVLGGHARGLTPAVAGRAAWSRDPERLRLPRRARRRPTSPARSTPS